MEMSVYKDGEWADVAVNDPEFGARLPSLIVGYTSGDNETFSLPFFVSRAGYAKGVREAAFAASDTVVADNRLLLIDYSTHLEVLVANLLLGSQKVRAAILDHAGLHQLASFPVQPGTGLRLAVGHRQPVRSCPEHERQFPAWSARLAAAPQGYPGS